MLVMIVYFFHFSSLNAADVTNIYAPIDDNDHSIYYDGAIYRHEELNVVLYAGDRASTGADHRAFLNFPLLGVDTNSSVTAATLVIFQKQAVSLTEWPLSMDHIHYSNVYGIGSGNTERSNRYHLNLPRYVIQSNFFMISNGQTVGNSNTYRIPCTTEIRHVMDNPKGYIDNSTTRIFQVRIRDSSSVPQAADSYHRFYPRDGGVAATAWPYVRVWTVPIPSTPSNVIATNDPLDYTRVKIIWNDSTNETSYKLFRSTNSSTNTATNIATLGADITNYIDNNITTNRTYFYWVKAYNSVGDGSPFSATESAFTRIPSLPDPPAWVQALVIGGGTTIDVSWSNVANETSYTLFRSTTNNPATAATVTNKGKNSTNFLNFGLAPITTYFYWVKAANIAGASGFSPAVSNTTGSNVVPVMPVLGFSHLYSTYDSPLRIEWNTVQFATHYLLYRSMTNNPATASQISSNQALSTNHVDTGFSASTTYFYWAKSYTGSNTVGFSTVVSNSTGQSIKLELKSESFIGDKWAVLTWMNLPSATNYKVYRGTSPIRSPQDASYTWSLGTNVTVFSDRSLGYNSTYYYNVGYTTDGTNYILDGPAEKFLSLAVELNDMKFAHRLELIPVYQDLITQAIPNPVPAQNPIISGDLVGAYKFRVYKVGDMPGSPVIRESSPKREVWGDASHLVDGKITDADYGRDDKLDHYGINTSPAPYAVFDFNAIVSINRVTIWSYKQDTRSWKKIAIQTSRFLEGPYTMVTNMEATNTFTDYTATTVDLPAGKRVARYVKVEITESPSGNDVVALAEVVFEADRYTEEVSPETISLQNKISLSLPFSDFDNNNVPEIYDTFQNIPAGTVNDLAVFMLSSGKWNYLGGAVDPSGSMIIFDSQDLGVFGIFPADKSKLEQGSLVFSQKYLTSDGDGLNEEIMITINPPKSVKADFLIFNLSGKLVRTLIRGQSINMPFPVKWNGRDDFNRRLPAGPYLYELRFDGEKEANGLMLIVR